jgi:hypothetical protein
MERVAELPGMSRTINLTIAFGALLAAPLIYALIRLQLQELEPQEFTPAKGTLAIPADAKVLAGHYYKGDGIVSCDLDLNPDMTYTMELWGCGGSDGRSSGRWSLTNSKVVFAPAEQSGVFAGPRQEMNVLRFRQHWVLLSDAKSAQESYREWGVSRYSCFQNTNFIYSP